MGFVIAEPNQAVIISGKKGKTGAEESQKYNILASGERAWVWPIIQSARTLPLDLRTATVPVDCNTYQGIEVVVTGVVAFKVGGELTDVAKAAQRFLADPDTMAKRVHDLFAGHIRELVGGMTVEALIREREKLRTQAQDATSRDMEVMGLVIDSLNIAKIEDPSGYIQNLSKPDLARVNSEARIAQADRDREASEKEAANNIKVADAQRETDIKKASFQSQVDKANAEAAQAGPLQTAESEKAVVERRTEVAQLEALRVERELESTVKKPADAAAYQAKVQAQGEKDAIILHAEAQADADRKTGEAQAAAQKAQGLAQAEVIKEKGVAEGTALRERADALKEGQDAVIAQQLAEMAPQIVQAAASAFDNVDNMTILNGADGVMDALQTLMAMGRTVVDTARQTGTANGDGDRTPIGAGANGGSN